MPHIANPRSAHPRARGEVRAQFHTLCGQNKNRSAGEAAFSAKVIWKAQKAFPSEKGLTSLALTLPFPPSFLQTRGCCERKKNPLLSIHRNQFWLKPRSRASVAGDRQAAPYPDTSPPPPLPKAGRVRRAGQGQRGSAPCPPPAPWGGDPPAPLLPAAGLRLTTPVPASRRKSPSAPQSFPLGDAAQP